MVNLSHYRLWLVEAGEFGASGAASFLGMNKVAIETCITVNNPLQ